MGTQGAREDLFLGTGESSLDAERLGDDGVIAVVRRRGAAVVGDDLSAVGAAEAGRRLARGREPRRLRRRKGDKRGVQTLGDGVAARAEGVGVVGGGEPDGGVDGVEDARPRAAEEAPPVVQRRRRRRRRRRHPSQDRPPPIKSKLLSPFFKIVVNQCWFLFLVSEFNARRFLDLAVLGPIQRNRETLVPQPGDRSVEGRGGRSEGRELARLLFLGSAICLSW